MKQIYLNTKSRLILTSDNKQTKQHLLFIGTGQHKKIIGWLTMLQAAMGNAVDSDLETLRKSWQTFDNQNVNPFVNYSVL